MAKELSELTPREQFIAERRGHKLNAIKCGLRGIATDNELSDPQRAGARQELAQAFASVIKAKSLDGDKYVGELRKAKIDRDVIAKEAKDANEARKAAAAQPTAAERAAAQAPVTSGPEPIVEAVAS